MAELIPCYICPAELIPQIMVRLFGENNAAKRDIAIRRRGNQGRDPLVINEQARICNNCNISIAEEIQNLANDPDCLRLNVLTQTRAGSCLICNERNGIHRMTLNCRIDIFLKRNIYIPEGTRCCLDHLNNDGFMLDVLLGGLRYFDRPIILRGPELRSFLQCLRELAVNGVQKRYENENNFSDDEFEALSPISKEQFNELFTYCERVPVPNHPHVHRYVSKKDLLCFLCKLRQGLSDEFLRVVFSYSSRQAVSMMIATVRQSLMARFVPENIGFQAIPRDQFIERHVTEFANALYNPEPDRRIAILYEDCTYLDVEKSSCFAALRNSYCVPKKRHLVKPCMLTGSDGYLLDIQGPYFSNPANNDARIMLNEFQNDMNGMREWLRGGDVFVLDRGYRDAIGHLEAMGMIVRSPPFLEQGQNQFTTEEANEARIVTITRWISEAINGHLKNIFKFFARRISTSHVSNLSDFLRIAGAIMNRYKDRIIVPNRDAAYARTVSEQAAEVNVVQARVEVDRLRYRRARWLQLTPAHFPLFPRMAIEQLHELTFGTYQVYLSPSYIQDTLLRAEDEIAGQQHVEFDSNYNEPGFARFRISSRFRRAGQHQVWITFNEEYDPENPHLEDNEPILGYYCICKSGSRTLGTCSHVAALIWYLAFARHQEVVKYPSLEVLQSIVDAAELN